MAKSPNEFKRRWKGLPWEQQSKPKSWLAESVRHHGWFMEYIKGASVEEIAEANGVTPVTVQNAYKRNQWNDRIKAFPQFDNAPDLSGLKERLRQEAAETARHHHTVTHLEEMTLQREREVDIIERIDDQLKIMIAQYDEVTEVNEKLWKATQIAVDALLADRGRLESLNVTEIKNLQTAALDSASTRQKLSEQAKGLDRLAEHVTKQLQAKRRRRAK